MSGRDANQLAAEVRAGLGGSLDFETRKAARVALDELVALVGTLQQERDDLAVGYMARGQIIEELERQSNEAVEAAEATLATNDLRTLELERRLVGAKMVEEALRRQLATTRQALATFLAEYDDGETGVYTFAPLRALADTGGDTE